MLPRCFREMVRGMSKLSRYLLLKKTRKIYANRLFSQPRTKLQFARRTDFPWLDWLDCCHRETCQSSQPCTMSKISAFEQANLGIVPVYITNGEKLQGSCVVAPYQVTRSSLLAIVLSHGAVSRYWRRCGDRHCTENESKLITS